MSFALLYSCLAFLCSSCTSPVNTVQGSNGRDEKDSVSFIVLGDWGVGGQGHQQAIADQMNIAARRFNTQFFITTGDNFYPSGVENTADPHWSHSFEGIYNKEGHRVAWYPTLGNHDYGLNPQAQVAYSAVSDRWKMPARYYTVEKNVSDSLAALFVFTDTSPFVRSYHRRNMADLQQQDTALQLQWLHQTLAASNQAWKVVVGHHPIYSSGEHGNTPELIQKFRPLLLQSKADFYLCGHDHILEHFYRNNDAVHYLISGGGGASTYDVDQKSHSRFAKSSPGFLVMTLYAARANIYFFNHNGEVLYQKQLKKG